MNINHMFSFEVVIRTNIGGFQPTHLVETFQGALTPKDDRRSQTLKEP